MATRKLQVDYGVWGTIRKIALLLLAGSGLVSLAFLYVPVLNQSRSLDEKIALKREALKKHAELQQKYTDEILALRSDPETVERTVRVKLGLVKPNEIIYRFESPQQDR